MCRLLGWSSASHTTAAELLGPSVVRLQQLSEIHEDGWGGAWHGPTGLELVREDGPAWASATFTSTITAKSAQTGLLHLRWATESIPRCVENTHPFVRDDVAFIHNGSVPRGEVLDSLIDDDLLAGVEGETDSERYFLAVLSAFRRTGSVTAAFSEVLGMLDTLEWPSLNAMWATPEELYVVCAHRPELRSPEHDPDYYELSYRTDDGVTTAWSSYVHDSSGSTLPNMTALVATAATGRTEIVPL